LSESKPQTPAQQLFGDIAPKLAEYSDNVLFGDLWERPELSPRDRSLITCAALIALGKSDQMHSHFRRAINNGVTQAELGEMITHLAFYSGWPTAATATLRAKELFGPKKD
jgi:4-carboxymuconolactone decarboxylase